MRNPWRFPALLLPVGALAGRFRDDSGVAG